MNVSLTGKLKDHVQERVADGTYTSASDYVRDLIRADIAQPNNLENLRRLIKEGLNSGEATPLAMSEIIRSAEQRLER
jgi:antitoxin ParD1/3/4